MRIIAFFKYWTIIISPFIFVLCSKDYDSSTLDNMKQPNVQMIAYNTNGETEEADALLICDDGSYLICDADNGNGYGTIHINTSVNNEFLEGATLFLDEDGVPIMASVDNGEFIFKNIGDNSFDFSFIDNKTGKISYYWDIPFPYYPDIKEGTTKAFYDPFINAWKSWKSSVVNFDWTWDEHQHKAIVPFLCKMGSFLFTAIGITIGTPTDKIVGIFSVFEEAIRSELFTIDWLNLDYASSAKDFIGTVEYGSKYYKSGWKEVLTNGRITFSPQKIGLSIFANALNQYGNKELEKLSEYEELVAQTFDGKEWQIKLSTYLLECSMEETTYKVDVSSKTAWVIDNSRIDHGWCSLSKEKGGVVVKLQEYDGVADRVCTAIIKSFDEREDISPATLTIRQSGSLFEISAQELIFTQEGGTQGIHISRNKNVSQWEVTSKSDWLETQKIQYAKVDALNVIVQKNSNLLEDREGSIDLTAKLVNGETITRHLSIKQIVRYNWNDTKWSFSGNIDVSVGLPGFGNTSGAGVVNFGIEIRDVENNAFSLSGDLAGMEKDSNIYCDEQNHLIWTRKETISEPASGTVSTTITFTRTSSTTAIGQMRVSVNGTGSGFINSVSGVFYGTRIDVDK